MIKLLSSLLGAVAGAFALALFVTLNVYLTPFLGAWMFLVDAVFILGALIFVSFIADVSIPLIRTILRRAYFRVKLKKGRAGELSKAQTAYLKILASLIVLFKSAEDGFELIKDEAHIIHGKALLFFDSGKGKSKENLKQLKAVHRNKQRRLAFITANLVTLFVVGSVLTGILSFMMYQEISPSLAATYTWNQSSWAGGATTTLAVHPGDQSGWTNYASKDSNITIDGSGNITMSTGVQDVEETTTADFENGTYPGWSLDTSNNEIKMRTDYYNASGICGDFGVAYTDPLGAFNWATAISYCSSLCSACGLPSREELQCICNNKTSFGNNFQSVYYWSSTSYNSSVGLAVHLNSCIYNYSDKSSNAPIRCVHR